MKNAVRIGIWKPRNFTLDITLFTFKYTFMYLSTTKMKNTWQSRTRKTVSFISSFITGIYILFHQLSTVLPHPLIYTILYSLFSCYKIPTCKSNNKCIIRKVLDTGENMKYYFFCDCVFLLNTTHINFIHFCF